MLPSDRDIEPQTGAGVYPVLRYINHVCPGSARENVAVAYPVTAHAKVLLASRDIKAGEELCWPYRLNPNHEERRKELKEIYNFSCECDVCTRYMRDSGKV